MKRTCSEAEKELLYKNRAQMLEGIYQTASRSKVSHIFIAIFLAVVTMIGGAALAVVVFHAPKVVTIIWSLFCLCLSYAIFLAILNTLRINRRKKAFMKKENLMINGATLVKKEDEGCFLYVEDDFVDASGKPILIEYPSRFLEISQEDLGKRLLVVYDGEYNFQLVKVNDELSGLIPNYSDFYPLTDETESYTRVAHPNIEKVDKVGHEITESERAQFGDLYVRFVQGATFRFVKIWIVAAVISLGVLCVLLDSVEDGYPIEKTLPIGAAVVVGLLLLMTMSTLLGKWNLGRQGRAFAHVKEVIFHSYVIEEHTISVIVYEWLNGKVQLCTYPAGNVASNTAYGSVLYKFTKPDGTPVLVNISPMGKNP